MDYLEKTARTIDEAIELALAELNITREQAEIEIVDEGSKGFLGIGKKEASVRVKAKKTPQELAINFLKSLTISMNVLANVEVSKAAKNLNIEISGENMGILIGKRGATLDAIQYLTNLVANKGEGEYVNIILDIENYREKRKKSLEILAKNLARKAKATGKSVSLEPMASNERRIIHFALEGDKAVKTFSQGEDPRRHVVIAPKGQ